MDQRQIVVALARLARIKSDALVLECDCRTEIMIDPDGNTHPLQEKLYGILADADRESMRHTFDGFSHEEILKHLDRLSRAFDEFYAACEIIDPDGPSVSMSRVVLCEWVEAQIKMGIGLLGLPEAKA